VQPASNYAEGVTVALIQPGPRAGLLPVGELGTAKTGNYLPNVLAVRDARARGAYEAFLVDPAGHVWEGASSNVFCVKDGRIRTPPLSTGILEGITRRHVLRIAQVRGHEGVEADVSVDDLFRSDEVFLTSTLREVVPVTRIDGHSIGDGRPGPVARELLAAFREEVSR
jgi:branched-chain amino acid aminotransferase